MTIERSRPSVPPIPTEANRSDRGRWKDPEIGQSVAGVIEARFERTFARPRNPDLPPFEVLVIRREDGGTEEVPCGRAELSPNAGRGEPEAGRRNQPRVLRYAGGDSHLRLDRREGG